MGFHHASRRRGGRIEPEVIFAGAMTAEIAQMSEQRVQPFGVGLVVRFVHTSRRHAFMGGLGRDNGNQLYVGNI
jgi:hypothetical protein